MTQRCSTSLAGPSHASGLPQSMNGTFALRHRSGSPGNPSAAAAGEGRVSPGARRAYRTGKVLPMVSPPLPCRVFVSVATWLRRESPDSMPRVGNAAGGGVSRNGTYRGSRGLIDAAAYSQPERRSSRQTRSARRVLPASGGRRVRLHVPVYPQLGCCRGWPF